MQFEIKNSFSKAAHTYDIYAEFQYFAAQKLVDAIKITPKYILDIGCGTGILSHLLQQKFPNACFTLLDISPDMLSIASNKLGTKNIQYMCGSADNSVLIDTLITTNNIDMIVSNLCLQWLKNPADLIKTYQSYAPTYISILLENSFYQWYESVKTLCPNFKPPIFVFPHDMTDMIYQYHVQYHTALEFLRSQKYLGTLINTDTALTVNQLKNACHIFENTYNATISYDLGILINAH
jgi:SAM-dependent methyltransferase